MIVEAYVLPYLGRSAGVVFWEARAAPRGASPPRGTSRAASGGASGARARAAEPDTLAVYAPGEVSPGEVATLQSAYVASLGRALREGGHVLAAGGTLFWWWVGGAVATFLLAARALEFGPGFAWLFLVAALTTLPAGAAGVAWPLGGRRLALARRLARRAARLVPGRGPDPRAQERVEGLWRLAGRLQGAPGQQLLELEGYCREQAWRQGARFYAERRAALGAPPGAAPGRPPGSRRSLVPSWWPRLRRWLGGLGPDHPPYAVTEMRAW
jgi:hypothetical protein